MNTSFSQCGVIYVTPNGTGLGTTSSDPTSITTAFTTANANQIIRLSTGKYDISNTLEILVDSLIIEGGFDASDNWKKTSLAGATTINRLALNFIGSTNQYHLIAIRADNKTGFELHDITVITETPVASSSTYGTSNYALYLNTCSNYAIVRTQLLPGNGVVGRSGEHGVKGASGQQGSYGGRGHCDQNSGRSGGAGGTGGGNGKNGGDGGAGGYGNSGGSDGDPGIDFFSIGSCIGNTHGAGATGPVSSGNQHGGNGRLGCSGANGVDGNWGTLYSFSNLFQPGGQGGTGEMGNGGAGGGGGGGGGGYQLTFIKGSGCGGSGGGGGGGGGTGGTGAFGGGGSFCVYAYNNGFNGKVIDCFFKKGSAGNRGWRGIGGDGGPGGAYRPGREGPSPGCAYTEGSGGYGARGGDGGDGGDGGLSYAGVSSKIVIVAGGQSLQTEISNFDLVNQAVITVDGGTCTNQNVTFQNGVSTAWTFGSNAIDSAGSGAIDTAIYSTTGFNTITTGSDTYTNFVYPTCHSTFSALTTTSVCNGYDWTAGDGQTYYNPGTYIYESINSSGCLQSDTLHLSITSVFGAPKPDSASLPDVIFDCTLNSLTPPTATDTCNNIIYGVSNVAFPITTGDTTVITWTFDDGTGYPTNISTQDQLVIRDNLGPQLELWDYDNNGDSESDNDGTTAINSFTVPAGDDRIVVIFVGEEDVLAPTVTFDTITLTLASAVIDNTISTHMYYATLGTGPAINGTISASISSSEHIHIMASSFEGIDQDNPIGNMASLAANDPSVEITGSTGNLFVDYFFFPGNTNLNGTSGQSLIAHQDEGGPSVRTESEGSYVAAYGGLNTLSYSATGTNVGLYQAIELNHAPLKSLTSICSVTPIAPPNAMDNCAGSISPVSNTSFPITTGGDTIITWTYDDGSGNVSTFDQLISITDSIAPVPDSTSLTDILAECEVTNLIPPTATDNCSYTVSHDAILPIATQGTTVVTWTFDDGRGNISTQAQNVIIDDVTSPTVSLIDYDNNGVGHAQLTNNINLSNFLVPAGNDRLLVVCIGKSNDNTMPNVTYNGQTGLLINEVVSGNATNQIFYFALGDGADITSTINASTSSSHPFHIIAGSFENIDQINPIGAMADSIGSLTPSVDILSTTGNIIVDYFFHTANNMPQPTSNQTSLGVANGGFDTQASFITANNGINTISYAVSSGTGIYQAVELNHVNLTVNDSCSVTLPTPVSGIDNCLGAIIPTTTTIFPVTQVGTTTVTWNYDDGLGNVNSFDQDIVITDNAAPTPDLSVLPDITVECEVITLPMPSATDNCSNATVTISHDAVLPITSQGTTVVTWTYDDGRGNTSTQQQNVVINDVTAPLGSLATLPDVTSECEVASLAPPVVSDNCATATITITHDAILPITSQGTTVVTWTYDDGRGNTSTQQQNVVINDVSAPVGDLVTLPDVTAECEVTALVPPTASDNCATATITVTHDAILPITNQGTTLVTWTYNDGHGNTSTQVQNVIITDMSAPVPTLVNLPDLIDNCEITSLNPPTATDNCIYSIVVVSNDVTLPVTTQGTTVVTWTYDDGHGNISTQVQNIVINDTVAPIATLASLPDLTDECEITNLTPPTATDNCANATITITNDAVLPITLQGTTTIIWTYDDGHGNTSTQVQNVIISDTTDPVLDQALLDDLSNCNIIETPTIPTATDNCLGTILGTTTTSFPITTPGLTVITWEFVDDNGNMITQTQNATINSLDATATLSGLTMTANLNGVNYLWVDCDENYQPIPGAFNQSFTATNNGNFAVIVSDENCADTSECITINDLSLEKLDLGKISIYPNPTSGQFNVRLLSDLALENGILEVRNVQGKLVHIQDLNSALDNSYQIELSGLKSGLYFVNVLEDKNTLFTKRLIITQ